MVNVLGDPVNFVDPGGLVKVYGNWCGPKWTGGYTKPWDQLTPYEQSQTETDKNRKPIDPTDGCCKTHDKCHAKCRKQSPCDMGEQAKCLTECDRALNSCSYDDAQNRGLFAKTVPWYMKDSNPSGELQKQCISPNDNHTTYPTKGAW